MLHESVANTRRDWQFKLAHYLCDLADNIFVEDINFISWSRGIVRKRSLESGIGQFINEILPYVSWKRGVFYLKVDKNGTSQECPHCHQATGKKKLSQRLHSCQFCGHTENRDTAGAKVIEYRGKVAVGQSVIQNACGDVLAGVKQLTLFDLVKESPVRLPRQLAVGVSNRGNVGTIVEEYEPNVFEVENDWSDFIGCVEGGPGDLATNKKHMQGFGENITIGPDDNYL